MDQRTEIITNKNEIDTIIENVNDSPRRSIFKAETLIIWRMAC